MRYYCPNLLFFKQRTSENSLKSILFFAEALKMRWLISSAYHKGLNGVYLSTKYGTTI